MSCSFCARTFFKFEAKCRQLDCALTQPCGNYFDQLESVRWVETCVFVEIKTSLSIHFTPTTFFHSVFLLRATSQFPPLSAAATNGSREPPGRERMNESCCCFIHSFIYSGHLLLSFFLFLSIEFLGDKRQRLAATVDLFTSSLKALAAKQSDNGIYLRATRMLYGPKLIGTESHRTIWQTHKVFAKPRVVAGWLWSLDEMRLQHPLQLTTRF